MKLSDIKKNADAKAAEAKAAQERAQQMRELDVHPLLKWGCDRHVRDAYFCGVVFAAVSDDDNMVDKSERKTINRIGRSLALSERDIGEFGETVIETVKTAIAGGGGDVFAALEESAASLKDEKVFRLFVAEYMKVCGAKEVGESEDVRKQLVDYACTSAGFDFNSRLFNAFGRCLVAANEVAGYDLVVLADALGDDVVRYLMLDLVGDVADQLKSARRSLVAKARSKAEKTRLERVRKAFEEELKKIGEDYEDIPSTAAAEWKDDICERLRAYELADIDWAESMNGRLRALNRIPRCSSSYVPMQVKLMRRKLIWKLVGMLWVAEKEIYPDSIDKLLSSARQLSAEGFREKIETFIGDAFDGVVELCDQ